MQKPPPGIDWLAFVGSVVRSCDTVGTKLYIVLQNLQPKQRNLSARHSAGLLAKKTNHRCRHGLMTSQHLKVKSANACVLRNAPSLKGPKLKNQASVHRQRSPPFMRRKK